MFGTNTRGYVYMRCDYGRQYGREAASAISGHGQWCSVREDALLPLALDFFEQRVFGASRMDLLARQLETEPSANPDREIRIRLSQQIADADAAIAAQVRGLEAGVDPNAVRARIEELKADRASHLVALAALAPDAPIDDAELAENLASLPDLSDALRAAEPAIQRSLFDAFALRVECDRIQGNVKIGATLDEAVATALGGVTDLPSVFCTNGHGGGRIRTSEG